MSRYFVPEMTCGHCKKVVEEALQGLDARAEIEVNLEKHEIQLQSQAGSGQIIAALKLAGYEATPL